MLRNNNDERDVWPGDYVSLQSEEKRNDEFGTFSCHKMGIVQSVHAAERCAQVRWFEDSVASISSFDQTFQAEPTKFGPISNDDYSMVSLYDITCHPAHSVTRGDMLIVVPSPLPPLRAVYQNDQPYEVKEIIDHVYFGSSPAGIGSNSMQPQLKEPSSEPINNDHADFNWFGEVIDVGMDGVLTVRLGAASEVRDIKLPFERCIMVARHESEDGSSESYEEDISDGELTDSLVDESTSDTDSRKTIEMEIEYEGGDRIDNESNDEMWTTDDEDQAQHRDSISRPSRVELNEFGPLVAPLSQSHSTPLVPLNCQNANAEQPGNSSASGMVTSDTLGSELQLSRFASKPDRFLLLEDSPPIDHHFIDKSSNIAAPALRRITREHRIMDSSLPEGVFVRTWESRLDLLRVLIVGPRDTPYELAPFVFDFHFTNEFPEKPPTAYFHSWTDNRGRINPNLYEDGKICLSLLGTWPGDDGNETWSAKGSTVLQVIVSLLGLVLVREPYFSKSFAILLSISG